MKSYSLDLQTDVVSSYDQTKTTVAGRATQKTLGGKTVLGPPLNTYMDVTTDAAVTPNVIYLSPNNRLFIISAITSGAASVAMYNFNTTTGAQSYVGKVVLSFPNTAATTHTIRGLKVDDSNTSNVKIFIATTGSVLINGGLFIANKLAISDFVPVGFPTIFFATASDVKAMYFSQITGAVGVANDNTAAAGLVLDTASTKIYMANGVSATYQFMNWDYSGTLGSDVGITGQTFTITIASPGVVTCAGHGFSNNDQVALYTTGALPTGLTASTAGGAQTVYFVRNAAANTFELSATSGGASINTTGAQSGTHTVRRAFGITSSLTAVKTGNLPALTGTLLLTNSMDFATPSHSANSGFNCVAFSTTTNLYLGKLSELTAAAVTWPSLITANVNGSPSSYVTLVPTNVNYSTVLDRFVMFYSGRYFFKQLVSNSVDFAIGATRLTQLTGQNPPNPSFGGLTFTSMDVKNGYLVAAYSGAGQIGVIAVDTRSHSLFDHTYVVSKVVDSDSSQWIKLATETDYPTTNNMVHAYYRTSGFGTITGGWTLINNETDLSAIASAQNVQFKYTFDLDADPSGVFAQIGKAYLIAQPNNEISDNWVGSVDNSTGNSVSPAKSAFRLRKAYATSVPTLYFRAYDDSGVLVASANTSANPTLFEYSTNNGSSWNALGTIPNTVNTTEVRYNWVTPPGVNVTTSIRES